jgi:pyruvate ferredoxin oxidoreductase alpha subunit
VREFLEGSEVVAKAIKLCRVGVIAAYPITPQTHIPETLARMVAEGQLKAEFVNVESEHSAASVVLGAVATGVRAYTATSSQGLLYMSEVIFNIAGMRLPVILTCANRAVSAPINIWNDQQDSMALRDSGWIQFYCENHQELVDLHIQAYRIAEDKNIMLPVMVNMDGYILTHGFETADLPSQEDVDKFLPPLNLKYRLDVENPLTLGFLADPEYYMETRYAIQKTHTEVLKFIPQIVKEFEDIFGRNSGGLIESYRLEDAEKVIVGCGSVCGTIREFIDRAREKKKKYGLLKIITYRPFPAESIYKALKDIPRIAVLDKAISLGAYGPLYTEIRMLFSQKDSKKLKRERNISGFIAGLGGRDITEEIISYIFKRLSQKQVSCEFLDLKPEYLE